MNKKRKNRYQRLREIRRERDYQAGLLQYADRPYTFRTARLRPERALTTTSYIKRNRIAIAPQ